MRQKLGSGTAGTVWEAFDEQRQQVVALKTLRHVDAAAIYRFKKEFRALADVSHRNLVQLYELLSDGDRWFFTMERVSGQTFVDYVRTGTVRRHTASIGSELPTLVQLDRPPSGTSGREPRKGSVDREPAASLGDIDRLLPALRQLVEGLSALHGAGKLHCDIKPSNVLVTKGGRVVLLDLGLVRDLFGPGIYESLDHDIVGTPAYMSPEQAAGLRITAASDWYSVGAMLYEALCGHLPFVGPLMKILTDKQHLDPRPPRQVLPTVPEDLDALCQALLRRDPQRRPHGLQILDRLGDPSGPSRGNPPPRPASSSSAAPFVGRQSYLKFLSGAFDDSRRGRTVAALVHGAAGMGKTALVKRFLEDLRLDEPETVILAGRCYQRETVPYKALDSLIDALSRYLRVLPRSQAESLLPRNVLALARLFPVLRRVEAVAEARRRVLDIPDSQELRRRAFTALRELFQRLADRFPVVLFIDDLHWGDIDSAALLREVLRPPDPPPLLLIACFRSEEALTSPLLKSLFTSELTRTATQVRELQVSELSPEESEELALRLLGGSKALEQTLAEGIARESGGSPFFIDALVRFAMTLPGSTQEGSSLSTQVRETTLDRAIEARLAQLPKSARQLLEVIAVAGTPVELEVAGEASGLEQGPQAAMVALRAQQLVRMRGGWAREKVEVYQERIREAILRGVPKERQRRFHSQLGRALFASGRFDPEALAGHFSEAGDTQQAAEFATQAADQAAEALAFDRASRLYRIALDLRPEGTLHQSLLVKLADALTNAGRGAEAAQAYLSAADPAQHQEAVELRRRAAEQLLISGRIDKGLATIRQVLASVGLELPPTPKRALISLLTRRGQLRWRGLKSAAKRESPPSAELLLRIDTCWSVSVGLGLVDILRGMDFGTRALLLSFEAGEPYRLARSLAMETGYSATSGSRNAPRTAGLIRSARDLSERVEHPHALGLTNLTAGIAAYLQGFWKKSLDMLEDSESILRERCTGVTWELDTAFIFQLRALLLLGEYGEIGRRLPGLLKEVQERGDLYGETNLRSRMTWVDWLSQDNPEKALREADEGIRNWSQQGFHLQHYWHMTGRSEIALYSGNALGAWDYLEEQWSKLTGSLLLRIQFTRVEAFQLRGRCALAAAMAHQPSDARRTTLLRQAKSALRRVEKEGLDWANPLADLVRGGIALATGASATGASILERAAEGLDKVDMRLHAAAARRRLGQLVGGSHGIELVRNADAYMGSQSITSPEKMSRVLAPGPWPEPPSTELGGHPS